MPLFPYPPDDATSQTRDANLNGTPVGIEDAVRFFLEVRTLMTGLNDKLKDSAGVAVFRNWCYSGLSDLGYLDCFRSASPLESQKISNKKN